MRTIILTGDARGNKTVGVWLRDLGFKLIEAGCEITVTRLDGPAAQDMLANRGMEVVQVVDAYHDAVKAASPPAESRAGARRFPPGDPAARDAELS